MGRIDEDIDFRIETPPALLACSDTGKRRGVFATRSIMKDEVVERCPVILIDAESVVGDLKTNVFNWQALGGGGGERAVALGWGSMYNHENPANLRYDADEEGDDPYLVFTAVREVAPGEEFSINYNDTKGGPLSERDVWFERHGIRPRT